MFTKSGIPFELVISKEKKCHLMFIKMVWFHPHFWHYLISAISKWMNKLQLNILQISFPPTNTSYSIIMYPARDRGQCLLDKRCYVYQCIKHIVYFVVTFILVSSNVSSKKCSIPLDHQPWNLRYYQRELFKHEFSSRLITILDF